MAIPEFYRFFRPVLETLQDRRPGSNDEIHQRVVEGFGLTAAELAELIPSGKRTRAYDRVSWSITYLRQAGLIETVSRGTCVITERGHGYLKVAPELIRPVDLMQFPEFADFQRRTKSVIQPGLTPQVSNPVPETLVSPEEAIENAWSDLHAALAQEVLDKVKEMPPSAFEALIVQLMLKLGYGLPSGEGGTVLGGTGDGGVDGVIDQDKLGLDKIYLQAKRWSDNTVSRKEVQAFVGALSGHGASKGVFMTTSAFTKDAAQYVKGLSNFKVSLVDGLALARLMIEHNLGVALHRSYDVKRIDSDYFTIQ